VGDLVLKPADLGEEELRWQEEALGRIGRDGFRFAPPLRAANGSLLVEGWSARAWLPGGHGERRWREIIAAGERFHAALSSVTRPGFLDRRTDPWASGDRVAWGEVPASDFADMRHIARLTSALTPVDVPSQLIHGDLTGNVLFADGLPPAIIDFSPYWRPTAFATAIVVGDLPCCHGCALPGEGAITTGRLRSLPSRRRDRLPVRRRVLIPRISRFLRSRGERRSTLPMIPGAN
jgi:uncharacterized protein (TIGR02569 family)